MNHCNSSAVTVYYSFCHSSKSDFDSARTHVNTAEGPADFRLSIAVSLDKLKQEISCPLCLDVFNDPKKLPCDRVYCQGPCLAKKNEDETITCPECCEVAEIPDMNASKFPPAIEWER